MANSDFSDEQVLNAQTIIRVGQSLGASQRDITIALMTALQESDLINMSGGDRDSAGLFQQRPSMGWGNLDQVTDPTYAATTFFKGKPGNPGLFSLKNRDQMTLTAAAQAVQHSAYPDAYAPHQNAALELLGGTAALVTPSVGGAPGKPQLVTDATEKQATPDLASAKPYVVDAPQPVATDPTAVGAAAATVPGAKAAMPAGISGAMPVGVAAAAAPLGVTDQSRPRAEPTPPVVQPHPVLDQKAFQDNILNPTQAGTLNTGVETAGLRRSVDAVNTAQSYLGTPYVWGGNSYGGVDCSGLVQQVFRNIGIELPRLSADQARSGQRIAMSALRPGDLVAWDNSVRNAGADHIAIYAGNGQIIEAPRPGLNVRTRALDQHDMNGWGVRIINGSGN